MTRRPLLTLAPGCRPATRRDEDDEWRPRARVVARDLDYTRGCPGRMFRTGQVRLAPRQLSRLEQPRWFGLRKVVVERWSVVGQTT